jgi:type IV secretory pathway protease TraF
MSTRIRAWRRPVATETTLLVLPIERSRALHDVRGYIRVSFIA